MGRKSLFLISCIILGVIACSPKLIIQKPEFIKITDVELIDTDRDTVIVRVRTLFRNPNAFGCTMENTTFSTFIDRQPLGASRIQGKLNINGGENFELILDSRLMLASLPKVLLSVFSKPEVYVEVRGQTTLVSALTNMTFSFNPKSRVEVKNRLKNMIRIKLLPKLTKAGKIPIPPTVAGEQRQTGYFISSP